MTKTSPPAWWAVQNVAPSLLRAPVAGRSHGLVSRSSKLVNVAGGPRVMVLDVDRGGRERRRCRRAGGHHQCPGSAAGRRLLPAAPQPPTEEAARDQMPAPQLAVTAGPARRRGMADAVWVANAHRVTIPRSLARARTSRARWVLPTPASTRKDDTRRPRILYGVLDGHKLLVAANQWPRCALDPHDWIVLLQRCST